MSRVVGRPILIYTLPTLAVVFGLWYLRHRRRRRDSHTDPGGILEKIHNPELLEDFAEISNIYSDSQISLDITFKEDNTKSLEVSVELDNLQDKSSDTDSVPETTVDSGLVESSVEWDNHTLEENSVDVEPKDLKENLVDPVDLTVESEHLVSVEPETLVSVEPEIITKSEDLVENSKSEAKLEEKIVETKEVTEDTMKKIEQGELVGKLASLELDTMKISGEKDGKGSERDSANHSPSEVMLASPSISNFSDAHSEGSSDSGKGHSELAASPPRTPAGGSSLAGDVVPSIYEFVLPQVTVGRLIGKHGMFLNEIKSTTHTNIFIKKHPETNKLKICAIEGLQQDIEKALAKIRQKFPLRRYPQLTLEKVCFENMQAVPLLKHDDVHLPFVEGVNNDVILSSLISAAHFFVQQPSHPSYTSLTALNHAMNQIYNTVEAPMLEAAVKDAICVAPAMGGWYRAQITEVHEENVYCNVKFLDYGGYLDLPLGLLRQIRGDLLMLPFQATECYLANVAPLDEAGWSEEARLFVQSITHGQILQAQIYDYTEDGTPLVYLYTCIDQEVILVNEALVKEGYALLATLRDSDDD